MTDMESRAREYFPESAWTKNDFDYILAFVEAEIASLRDKVGKDRGYPREVADVVLRKIQEIGVKTGRNMGDPFADNNLPSTTVEEPYDMDREVSELKAMIDAMPDGPPAPKDSKEDGR